MKQLFISLRLLGFFTLLCGIIYPLVMTGVGQTLFNEKAHGQLITQNENIVGSHLLAQKFERADYFWPRPSAVDYNPLPSGGSNLGPTAQALKEAMQARKLKWQETNQTEIPKEMLFASASGLDPHLSSPAALAQIDRVAKARGLEVGLLQKLVADHTEARSLGLLGEATVNVLALNMALDKLMAKP